MEKLEAIAVKSFGNLDCDTKAKINESSDTPSYTGVSLVNREVYNGGTSIMYWM